jgi:hypothetical protein
VLEMIADASAKVARSFYLLRRITDNVLLASLGQLTGLGPSRPTAPYFGGEHYAKELTSCKLDNGSRIPDGFGFRLRKWDEL